MDKIGDIYGMVNEKNDDLGNKEKWYFVVFVIDRFFFYFFGLVICLFVIIFYLMILCYEGG